ncbi:MAG: polymerase beta domain protein region [Segetibacter sp.]|nr:polymerase beta domain protein region [Segetibacter sp.]
MTHTDIIKSKLSEALPQLKQVYPIARIALFGSVTRSDYNPSESDIDIMVEFSGDMGYEFIELAEELERLLQKKVDLVSRNALKPHHWDFLKSKMLYV